MKSYLDNVLEFPQSAYLNTGWKFMLPGVHYFPALGNPDLAGIVVAMNLGYIVMDSVFVLGDIKKGHDPNIKYVSTRK
jgi:hypothetical protein